MTGEPALRVTVRDLETGDEETQDVPLHDYMLLTTGDCTASFQVYPKSGTHVITIKGRKP